MKKSAIPAALRIPGVGPATAGDLLRLGIRDLKRLSGKDPFRLYERLCALDGARHDPCVIDQFMMLVHYADTGEVRAWYSFTPARKALQAARARPAPRRRPRS